MSELEQDGGTGSTTSRDAFAYAAKHNIDVRYPLANELFVDIDSKEDLARFDRVKDLIHIIHNTKLTPSRSKPDGKHIVCNLDRPVTPLERIALQAILGSDPRREAHSFNRLQANDPLPTLFFEKRK